MVDYNDLEIGLYRQDVDSYAVELRFRRPDDEVDRAPDRGLVRFNLEDLRQYMLDPEAYGQTLSQSLFADQIVREAFSNACVATQTDNSTLRLRLFIDRSAPELHNLRWETLRDPRDGSWLLTKEDLLFSRYLRSSDWRQVQLRPKGDLRALVVIANPRDLTEGGGYKIGDWQLTPVDVEGELLRVKQSLTKPEDAKTSIDTSELVSDPKSPGRATLNNLIAELRDGYDILYLVCHGAMFRKDPQGQKEPYLWLEEEDGSAAVVPGTDLLERLRDLPHRQRPRLVVLASCQSAGQGAEPHTGDEGALAALGPRLAEAGIPVVLAMQGNVFMNTVARFMPVFFEQLCTHGQIDQAMAAARGMVRDRPDRWMPTLFMRLRNGRIWYVPGFADEQTGFERWPNLLSSIHAEKCTPILGSGLIEFLLGSSHEIARNWVEAEHFPLAPNQENLVQVAQYLATSQSPGYLREKLTESLKSEIWRRYGKDLSNDLRDALLDKLIAAVGAHYREMNPFEPHYMLAQLPLPIYITTNPDNLLAEAMKTAGKDPQIEFCRWNEQLELLPSIYDDEKDYRPTVERPLIYHLFGYIQEPDSLVLSEDDYFDYLMWVNKTEAQIPRVVSAAWSANSLLFLGFQMDDWNFRVLFRSIMNEERRYRRRNYKSVAVQINPEEDSMQPEWDCRYLKEYFQGANIDTYWGSAEDFVKELWSHWSVKYGGGQP